MKQTAVEQFIEKLEDQEFWQNMSMQTINISIKVEDYLKLKEQAKQMEKEQIIKARLSIDQSIHIEDALESAEEYYNQTFKSE